MNAVCVPLIFFLFELLAQSQGPRAQTVEGTEYELTKLISIHQPSSYHSLQQVTSFLHFCQQKEK